MKFVIEGSQSELVELIKRLGGIETETKKAEISPLLTELAETENKHIQTGNELAETIKHNREMISSIKKMNEMIAKQCKENAPQAETAETKLPVMPVLCLSHYSRVPE